MENVDYRGKPCKSRKLRPDAVPSLGLGKTGPTPTTPSGSLGILDPAPGTSFETVSDVVLDMQLGDDGDAVELQCLESISPEIVVEQQSSEEPIIIDIPVEPHDPKLELIEQLRAEINILKKLREDDQKNISELKKENAKLLFLKDYVHKMEKVFSSEQLDMLAGKIQKPKVWSDFAINRGMHIRYMCHASGYEFLRSLGFPFPSYSSILERMALINFSPGLLEDNIRLLKMYLDALPEGHTRDALICYDEMSIKEGLEYNPTRQQITGFIDIPRPPPRKTKIKINLDIGEIVDDDFDNDNDDDPLLDEKFRLIANNVCVFMIAGLQIRWKIPIAFFFTGHSFEPNLWSTILCK